jgi:hypothetical protein
MRRRIPQLIARRIEDRFGDLDLVHAGGSLTTSVLRSAMRFGILIAHTNSSISIILPTGESLQILSTQ